MPHLTCCKCTLNNAPALISMGHDVSASSKSGSNEEHLFAVASRGFDSLSFAWRRCGMILLLANVSMDASNNAMMPSGSNYATFAHALSFFLPSPQIEQSEPRCYTLLDG